MRQPKTGQRARPVTRQIRVKSMALFPKRREYGEQDQIREDEPRTKD